MVKLNQKVKIEIGRLVEPEYPSRSKPSPSVMSFGSWPKRWERGFKCPKKSSELGIEPPLLHIEVVQHPIKILLGAFRGFTSTSNWYKTSGENPELTGGIIYISIYLMWLGNASGSLRRGWKTLLESSRLSFLTRDHQLWIRKRIKGAEMTLQHTNKW